MRRALCIVLLVVSTAMGSAHLNGQSSPQSGRSPQKTDLFSEVHIALDESLDTALAATSLSDVSRRTDDYKVVEVRSVTGVTGEAGNIPNPGSKRGAAIERLEQLRPLVEPILRSEGVPLELAFLVVVESGGRLDALSPKGARGLWQFMPDTARRYGLFVEGEHDERLDVRKSTRAAAQYLRDLHLQFNSWPLALAAYNAGEPAVQKAIDRAGDDEFTVLTSRGLLPEETRNYVPAVLNLIEDSGASNNFRETPRRRSGEERIVYARQNSEVLP